LVAKSIFNDVILENLSNKTRVFTCGKIGVIERELERYLESGKDAKHGLVNVVIVKGGKVVKTGDWQTVKSSPEMTEYRTEDENITQNEPEI
jgi:hypothetical protein